MSNPPPQTEQQLLSEGYSPVTVTEWQNLLRKLPHATSSPHAKSAVGAKRCVPGTQCYETPCVDGKKGVIFCDGNGICSGNQYIIDC